MTIEGNVAAVIPVFNPEPGLKVLAETLLGMYKTVVVVDDGSCENIEDFDVLPDGVQLVRHEVNRGKGRAIKTGIRYLKDNRPEVDVAVFVDGDGQHRPDDVKKVVDKSLECGCPVLGVRNFREAGIPFRSRFGNVITAGLVRLMYKIPIYDTQTGLRAIPGRLFDMMLETDGERYEYEMRLFGKLSDRRERLEQVDIETIYIESNRASHFRPLRDTVRIYRGLFGGRFLKFIGSSLAGFVIDNGIFALSLMLFSGMGVSRSVKILLSFVAARLVSSAVNYMCNRKWVFRSEAEYGMSVGKYLTLAVCVMSLSYAGTVLFSQLFDVRGVAITAVKILVDVVLFVLSYRLQKLWVFK
jgi:glycosyltransferase involved in cell wall biosynthesis